VAQAEPRPPPPAPAPAAAHGGDADAIDLSVLSMLLGYDEAKVSKFALAFLNSSRDGIGDMEAALARGDMETVRQLGHRIKGAARTVGAFPMGDLCEELEQLAPGEAGSGQASATAIVAQLQALLPQLARHIERKSEQNDGSPADAEPT
jgi:HPt (histidine-containing phosphotransfer) domain-containing protein